MSEYVYLLRPVRPEMPTEPTADEISVVGVHFQYLSDAVIRGQAVLVGRTLDAQPLGIVVFEADSPEEAEAFKAGDPAVMAGIMTAEVHPFHIALVRGRDDT